MPKKRARGRDRQARNAGGNQAGQARLKRAEDEMAVTSRNSEHGKRHAGGMPDPARHVRGNAVAQCSTRLPSERSAPVSAAAAAPISSSTKVVPRADS